MRKRALGVYAVLVLAALYAPLAILAVFSFSASPSQEWTGLSLRWYREMAEEDRKSVV